MYDPSLLLQSPVENVLALKTQHAHAWREMTEDYWLARLMREVGELSFSLVGGHDDPPEWELTQIAAICLNWLEYRNEKFTVQ